MASKIHLAPGRCQGRLVPPGLALAAALIALPAWALDLAQSYRLAIQRDARYNASRAETAASREALPQARAQLMPTLYGSVARSKSSTDRETVDAAGDTVKDSFDYFSGNYVLTLRQPVFRMYNIAAYRQARSEVEGAEALLDNSRQDLAVRLATAYFEALLAQDQWSLVEAQKTAYAAQLAASQSAFEAGQGTRTDIDDAQARYDMTLALEVEVQQNVEYTQRQLQTMVNQPIDGLSRLQPDRMQLVPPVPASVDEWIRRGEDANAELRAMRAGIEVGRKEIDKARAGHLPTVDLVAQRSRTMSENNVSINARYATTMVGFQMSVPIFAGGYNSSQVRKAEATLEKLELQYEARRREIALMIRKEFQNIAEGMMKVKALVQAERSAEQAVYSNEKGFRAGMRTRIDILNAQQQRMNVKRDLAQARYQYILARIRLSSLMASSNEEEIGVINGWLK